MKCNQQERTIFETFVVRRKKKDRLSAGLNTLLFIFRWENYEEHPENKYVTLLEMDLSVLKAMHSG